MKKFKKIVAALAILAGLFSYSTAFAAVGDQGVDWAVYQGDQGQFGYTHDKFSISQIGGYNRLRYLLAVNIRYTGTVINRTR